ncbi:MAG TPA: efflux RND transporter periplasmic adaptor subunit [Sphaerochaeta sp.]|nr:efflux RND transporter periplasmic adaptor subunit [Sphaerochaeta sp.]
MVKKRSPRKKLGTFLSYFGLLLILVSIGYGAYAYFGQREKTSYVDPPPPVVITQPTIGSLEQSITLSGTVEAKAFIPVVPFVSGTIQEYLVKEGEYIEQDDIIAIIDRQAYLQQLAQAQAAYSVAESTYERVNRLYEAKATTQQNREQALAQRDATKAQLELATLQLDWATVTAPVSGTLLSIPSAAGNIASSNQPVAIMADLSQLVVKLQVPERYFDIISENAEHLSASVERPRQAGPQASNSAPKRASAEIEGISSYIQPQSKTFLVTCLLTEGHTDFRPGMHVQVNLIYERYEDVPLVSQTVRTIDGNAYLYDAGRGRAQWIELTPVAENNLYLVLPSELSDASFIVDGHHRLFDGQRVTVVDSQGTER